jgi:hypothetical protein
MAGAGQLSFSVVISEFIPNKLRGPFNALVLSPQCHLQSLALSLPILSTKTLAYNGDGPTS